MKDQKVGLFLGKDRGAAVLSRLLDDGVNVSDVLILAQNKHEYDQFSWKISSLCESNGITWKSSSEVKPAAYQSYLKSNSADIVFVVSWRFMISKACFNIPEQGILIVHDALLPRYRGFAPTNWAIINGEKETGATLFYIAEDIDSGDIIDQVKIQISQDETAKTLNDKFLQVYPDIISRNLPSLLDGTFEAKPQDHSLATFVSKRGPDDGHLDFSKTAKEILQLIRGLTYPYPGAWAMYNNEKVLIWEAEILDNPPIYEGLIPGRLININKDAVDVLVSDGVLRIKSIGMGSNQEIFLKPNNVLNSISHKLL